MKKDIVVITGAASGIGRALCHEYGKRGEAVLGVDINGKALEQLKSELYTCKGSFEFIVADLSSTQSRQDLLLEILQNKKYRIQTWIHSAGISGIQYFLKQDQETFLKVVELNLNAVVDITRKLLPEMEKNGRGQVVILSSMAGMAAAAKMTAYCASKHALIGFARSLQAELAMQKSSIHLMLVLPGFVNTPIVQLGKADGLPEWMERFLPPPEDIAKSILKGLQNKKQEIHPTLNGLVIKWMDRLAPRPLYYKVQKLLIKK